MKLSNLIKSLQEIKKEHGDLNCFYSIDEEGNSYDEIFYDPSVLYQHKKDSDEIMCDEDFEDDPDLNKKDYKKIVVVN